MRGSMGGVLLALRAASNKGLWKEDSPAGTSAVLTLGEVSEKPKLIWRAFECRGAEVTGSEDCRGQAPGGVCDISR